MTKRFDLKSVNPSRDPCVDNDIRSRRSYSNLKSTVAFAGTGQAFPWDTTGVGFANHRSEDFATRTTGCFLCSRKGFGWRAARVSGANEAARALRHRRDDDQNESDNGAHCLCPFKIKHSRPHLANQELYLASGVQIEYTPSRLELC